MLRKFAITDIEQLNKAVKDAQSIVIYGCGYLGGLAVDYLIEMGNRDKIAAIVCTRGSKNSSQNYCQFQIQEASAFFVQPEHKAALVIVSVMTPKFRDEICEALENYGVQTCSYLDLAESALAELVIRGARHSNICSFIFTEGQLCDLVDHANEVVIYSTEECGDRLVNYLERVGRSLKIKEHIRLIQESSGKYSAATFPANLTVGDTLVLVALDHCLSLNPYIPLGEVKNLDSKHYYFCTTELMERLLVLLKDQSQEEVVQEIQFVVAGFGKCGTTSLHYALQKVEDIYLPDGKETLYFTLGKSVGASKEKWRQRFFNHVPKGNVSGCIEPSFALFAKEIRETLGSDLRICFLVRNPVGATYSRFRMHNRVGAYISMSLYTSYGKYCNEMFDDYITALLENRYVINYYEYADILEEFLRYYPMKQIKVVIFEELIREPGKKINEILRFVGSKEVYDPQLGLPKENTGDFVWADQEGALLGIKMSLLLDEKRKYLCWHILDNPETALARANEVENEIFHIAEQMEAAEKIYNPKMTPEQRKRLEDFYRPSVRKLEKMLDKDLSKLWFE